MASSEEQWWSSTRYGTRFANSEIHGDACPDLHLSLWDIFSKTVSTNPEGEAVVSLWQPDPTTHAAGHDEPCRWTYRQLQSKAQDLASVLYSSGCRPGMRLAALVGNSAEWALLFWTAARLRMAFAPIDPRVSARDVEHMLSSVRPQVLVAQDADTAAAADKLALDVAHDVVYIQCAGETSGPWKTLQHVLGTPCLSLLDYEASGDDCTGLIIFTSGTTGNPKACLHTNANLIAQMHDYDPNPDTSSSGRWLVHTPVSHIFGVNNALRAWRNGGAAIFPSKVFDVDATIQALSAEKCTAMSATPTLIKMLLANPRFPPPSELNLGYVILGGTSITRADIELCRERLGAKFALQAYGMSEGAPLISWSQRDDTLIDGFHSGVGKVLPGAAVRICRVGSADVVDRGEAGELHIGGPSVISGYLGHEGSESFYEDDSGIWLMTGDQAIMDEEGVVYIVGRYKDLIIRGGENIWPAKIEAALSQLGIQASVVGVPDAVAGQVPVAIVNLSPAVSKEDIAKAAADIGSVYILDSIYTLEELGMERFPLTALGKMKKGMLRDAVIKMREASQATPDTQASGQAVGEKSLEKSLRDIWEQLTGIRLAADASVRINSDSILLLRYCDAASRKVGKKLYLQDVLQYETFAEQASLLQSRPDAEGEQTVSLTHHASTTVTGPMQIHSHGWTFIPENIKTTPAADYTLCKNFLEGLGLQSLQIERCSPIRSSLRRMVAGQRPQSYHIRMVYKSKAKSQDLRAGLENLISSRQMLRTLLCSDTGNGPLHVAVSSCQELYKHLIENVSVSSEEEAGELCQDDTVERHSSPFMFKADIITVENAAHRYVSLTWNHSIIDAVSLISLFQDLDYQLSNPSWEIPRQTPYHYFTDLLHDFQDSKPEKAAVSFHASRLQGISRLQEALWPRQKAPGWMISNDASSEHRVARHEARQDIWNGAWEAKASMFRYPRCGRVVHLPDLKTLETIHGITPAVVSMCALVIFNTGQTGSSYASFTSWESGRSWPFVPPWMEKMLPPAMSVQGPTVEWILHLFKISREETVLDFLRRLAGEITQAQKHAHAPWDKIIEQLHEEGPVAVEASFRQSFVWDVSIGFKNGGGEGALQPHARYDWADCGIFWNAYMLDSASLHFVASWDTAQMNDVEVDGHCDKLAEAMRRLCERDNWNKPIGVVFP
ncbi:hypothetical protein B0I35DRAFT_357824 [Stachybotrys elegans]|uniref:AMP-dependent synthetase/ligase domain-containing protein n=1 Tax=Stachybotrys elegans TaxID=80388 RepID=A0A8K0SLK5_9HYPO|nr:hypothetical protein B0I35DRAFT_357824 [Stachybotrys elegans]